MPPLRPPTRRPLALAAAFARRYSGSFQGLPRVRHDDAWNEPNLNRYSSPQRQGGALTAPEIYRDLLNGLYDGVKKVHRSSAPSTASGGSARSVRGGASLGKTTRAGGAFPV